MKNIDFLAELIKSECDYWVVSREQYVRDCFESKRAADDIILISLPVNIKRGVDINTLTLKEVKEIDSTPLYTNIYLTGNFSPFQYGLTVGSFYRGFELKGVSANDFIKSAWELDSKDIWKYEELMKSMQDEKESNNDHQ